MATNKNIQIDRFGANVRIERRKQKLHQYFANSQWGGQERALEAAKKWRDDTLLQLHAQHNRHLKTRENRSLPGINGVTRTIRYDKRRDAYYLAYSAFWMDLAGGRHNRNFQAGRLPDISAFDQFKAYRAAVIFRKTYEWCLDHKLQFNPEKFIDWKHWL